MIGMGCKCGVALRVENDEDGELRFVHPTPLCKTPGAFKPILLDNEDMKVLFVILDDVRAELERRENMFSTHIRWVRKAPQQVVDKSSVAHFKRLGHEMEIPNMRRLAKGKLSHHDELRQAFYYAGSTDDPELLRELWVRVAAVAIAGVESLDRKKYGRGE